MGQENTGETNKTSQHDDAARGEDGTTKSPESNSARDADAAQRSQQDAAWRPAEDVIGQNPEGSDEDAGAEDSDAGVGSAQGGA